MNPEKLRALIFSFKNNKLIFLFFAKLILLIVFTISIYTYVLKPIRIPDKLLTESITKGTVFGINLIFSNDLHVTAEQNIDVPSAMNVNFKGRTFLRIFDACNGLELIAIYVGLIVLLPYNIKRKLAFIIVGTAAIVFANIIRCIALYWIYIYHNSMFDFNHHYVFTILIYLLIFYCWILFIKKGRKNEV